MPNGVIVPCDVNEKQNITSTTCTVVVQTCKRIGKVVVFNAIVSLSSNLSSATEIFKFPWKTDGRYDFFTTRLDNVTAFTSIADNSDSLVVNAQTMTAGTYIIMGAYVTRE